MATSCCPPPVASAEMMGGNRTGTPGGEDSPPTTPTMTVRARPRVPTTLLKARPVVTTSDHSSQSRMHDLVGVLTSFRHTDFVRKYSFRGSRRSPTWSGASSPSMTVQSSPTRSPLLMSPRSKSPDSIDGSCRPHTSSTLPRVRSLKIRLENIQREPPSKTFSASTDLLASTSIAEEDTESQVTPTRKSQFSSRFNSDKDIAGGQGDRGQGDRATSQRKSDTDAPPFTSSSLSGHKLCSHIRVPSASLESMTSVGSDATLASCEERDGGEGDEDRVFTASMESVTSETALASLADSTHDSLEEERVLRVSESDSLAGRKDSDSTIGALQLRRKSLTANPTSSMETEDEGVTMVDMGERYEDVYVTVTSSAPGQPSSSFTPGDYKVAMPPQLQCHVTTDSDTNRKAEASNGGKRFLTHPPMGDKIVVPEAGSMDSNGLGALRDPQAVIEPGESVASLTDSDVWSGEMSQSPTSTQSLQEQKIGLQSSLKLKSKSAPCGDDKHKQSVSTSSVTKSTQSQALSHSTPLLKVTTDTSKPKSKDASASTVTKAPSSPSVLRRTRAKGALTSNLRDEGANVTSEEEDLPRKQHRRSSKRRQRHPGLISIEPLKVHKDEDTKGTPVLVEAPDSESTSDSTSHLNLPSSSSSLPPKAGQKSTGLIRSHSSASVYIRKNDGYGGSASNGASSDTRLKSQSSEEAPEQRQRVGGSRPIIPHQFGLHLPSHASTPDLGVGGGGGAASPSGKPRRNVSTSSFSPSLEPIFSRSTLSLFDGKENTQDKRSLIVRELVSTEQLYVESLQVLVERYMIPLKSQGILDSNLVDDIFYKINEIYMHHAIFLTFLEKAVANWTPDSTVGNTIHKNFSKQTVIESYVSFIENFPKAEKVLDDLATKTSFQKFIDSIEKESRNKLPLKAQIVKPAQRIPRYELLIKRLLENTPACHPDGELLKEAEKSIHTLALKINSVKESKQEHDLQQTLKKLELLLITELVSPERFYVRHDMVTVLNRKDQCCVWLFNDIAVFSAIKRKTGPVNRKTSLLLRSSSGHDFVENTKHKLWLKIALEDLEIVTPDKEKLERDLVAKEILEDDSRTLTEIQQLSGKLFVPHDPLEETVRELVATVNKQLSQHQLKAPPPQANRTELLATTHEGLASITLIFPSQEKKAQWETAYKEIKSKLAAVINGKPPEFLQALQITKTRAGMQFSCAAPINSNTDKGYRDVWVCNSDGYVGHMCLLSLQPEPIVTLNTPVPGCNSRILTICNIPALQSKHHHHHHQQQRQQHRHRTEEKRRHGVTEPPRIRIRADSTGDGAEEGYLSDSSSSSTDSDTGADTDRSAASTRTSSRQRSVSPSSRTPTPQSTPKSTPKLNPLHDTTISTVWLGTEDGGIHIFPSKENIKTTKSKLKLQQNAGVLCIVHMQEKVFASLANGVIVVYRRTEDGIWDTHNPETVTLTSANAPINKMLRVADKLWCASLGDIMVVDPDSMEIEVTFSVNPDSRKGLQCLVCSGQSVWLAAQGSSKVSLYHAATYEQLTEVDVAPAVAAKLQGADDIIRQHKSACLRITALLTCKELLWMGTSAGVLLTLPMPKVTSASDKTTIQQPQVTGLVYGHTGHVRFLTSVEVPLVTSSSSSSSSSSSPLTPQKQDKQQRSSTGSMSSSLGPHLNQAASTSSSSIRRHMSAGGSATIAKVNVISGGDGYEDFRMTAPAESAGKDDSTNHLLLWQV